MEEETDEVEQEAEEDQLADGQRPDVCSTDR